MHNLRTAHKNPFSDKTLLKFDSDNQKRLVYNSGQHFARNCTRVVRFTITW